MLKSILLFNIIALINCMPIFSNKKNDIFIPDAKPEKLSDIFSFTEGPAADEEGNVYFTDQPNDRIYKWSVNDELSIFLEGTGRANGMYFDHDGNLISCSDMNNEIWSINKSGKSVVLVTNFENKKLNGPNDLWVDSQGGIYFTDPMYTRDYWKRNPEIQQNGEHVYYLSPDRKTLKKVITDLEKPNGIVGCPKNNLLYVADIQANRTYVYTMKPDGSLSNKRLFASLGSDGMTIDEKGNIYLTGRGVTVFNKEGVQIKHIPIEADWTSNVCFGGKERNMLFITASKNLYRLKMNVKGIH